MFWITDKWSLMGGGCLQSVVANGGSTIIYVVSLDYFVYIVFLAWEHTFGSTLPSDRNLPFTEIFGNFLDSYA